MKPHTQRSIKLLCALFIISFFAFPAHAQNSAPTLSQRPKICLVLSGGGARGAVHIGVLETLEALRVPIDCIIGTSIGALVGGAYASGMSIEEMKAVTEHISTQALFKERPPRSELTLRRKKDDGVFFGAEFGVVDGKINIGSGLVTGVKLETVLRTLSKTKGQQKFDQLPIPFRAIATNLETGQAVIFDEGELSTVMRASMAIPGLISPIEIDGKILVDGGLTSNLSVETAFEMGADMVIAVNAGTPLLNKDKLNSILGITAQMIGILTEQNVSKSIKKMRHQDILISPKLSEHSSADFDKFKAIIPLGKSATLLHAKKLQGYALPKKEYLALRKAQSNMTPKEKTVIHKVRVAKLQRVNEAYAKSVMNMSDGDVLDKKQIDGAIKRLYGTGDFEQITYDITHTPNENTLTIHAIEKNWGPDYLRAGLSLESDFEGNAFFDILGSYRKTWINSLGAEWRTDVQLGHTRSIRSEFYQPLTEDGHIFIAPRIFFEREINDLYEGDTQIGRYEKSVQSIHVDIGAQFKEYGELRLGISRGSIEPKIKYGEATLIPYEEKKQQGGLSASIKLDQLDSVIFPRSGWEGNFKIYDSQKELGADDNYTKWEADISTIYSYGEHTFNLMLQAGGSIGDNQLPYYDQFQWGGFLKQSGYASDQLYGESMRFARLMYYRRLLRGGLLEGAYGGVSLEYGKISNPLVSSNSEGWEQSMSLFVGADSPIGPVYLGYGRTRHKFSRFYFHLGRTF